MFAPVTVTHNRDRCVVARRFLFRQECTPSRELNAEHREIVRGDDRTKRAAGIALLAETDKRDIETHHVAEDRILLANVEIGGIGKTAEFFRILFALRKELHHFVRFGISRRGKEKRVHQGEYGGIHANAEREHGYRCNRKGWCLEQLTESKFKITNHGQAL